MNICSIFAQHFRFCVTISCAKLEKCAFCKQDVEFVGYIVSRGGVQMMQDKLATIRIWPALQKITEVKSFLGFAHFYRKHFADFAAIAQPLTTLTRNQTPWQWTDVEQNAFDKLKQRLVDIPILIIPDPQGEFIVTTDASGTGIGAVLQQKYHGKLRPVAIYSRLLSDAKRRYATHEKEALAVWQACKVWRPYLHNRKVTVFTDHQP
jgi:RNase H-like domain found in reverse transcriptase